MSKNEQHNLINIASIIRILLIVLTVLIVVISAFFFFRTRILAKHALRDAKNVYLALSTAEIEYYSKGKNIYDPSKVNGMSEGVERRVHELVDNEGTFRIVSYDNREHCVTGMQYVNGNYYVFFSKDGDELDWEVKYLMPIYQFAD